MQKTPLSVVLAFGLSLCSCAMQTRSISNPGWSSSTNELYNGELELLDIVGADASGADGSRGIDIASARKRFRKPTIAESGRCLLIQSGAAMPDPELVDAFGPKWKLMTMTGIPDRKPGVARGQEIRLAAARGGFDSIICVWGTLESKREQRASKSISWIPVIGWSINDERLYTRIRLRFVLIDVATGHWRSIEAEPFEDSVDSSLGDRGLGVGDGVALSQSERLKRRAYADGVRKFLRAVSADTP